jgi:GNAT superfamily N-acetyltransferase
MGGSHPLAYNPGMTITVRMLTAVDGARFAHVADGLFDDPLDPAATHEFLNDPRHYMAAALDGGTMVGFASAVRYAHPDKKRAQFWVNELAVVESHQRRGLARAMMALLAQTARDAGCFEMWVGTEVSNTPARRTYESAGAVEDDENFVSYAWDLDDL